MPVAGMPQIRSVLRVTRSSGRSATHRRGRLGTSMRCASSACRRRITRRAPMPDPASNHRHAPVSEPGLDGSEAQLRFHQQLHHSDVGRGVERERQIHVQHVVERRPRVDDTQPKARVGEPSAAVRSRRCGIASSRRTLRRGSILPAARVVLIMGSPHLAMSSALFGAISSVASSPTVLRGRIAIRASTIF